MSVELTPLRRETVSLERLFFWGKSWNIMKKMFKYIEIWFRLFN